MTHPTEHEDPEDSGVFAAIGGAVQAVDSFVPEEDNGANSIASQDSRYLPWVGTLFAVCAVLLVPWVVYIAVTLPARELSPNYDVAWAGFDVMLFAALASTAVTVFRRSRWIGMAAGWTAGLLVTDSWFDTVTAPAGWDTVQAIVLSVVVELPLAALCVWTCLHAVEIAERRVRVLLGRTR